MNTEVKIVHEVINLEIFSKKTEKRVINILKNPTITENDPEIKILKNKKRSKSELMAIIRSSNDKDFENKIKEENKNLELNKYINNFKILKK